MASNFNFWMGFVMGGALAAMIVRIRETLVRRIACHLSDRFYVNCLATQNWKLRARVDELEKTNGYNFEWATSASNQLVAAATRVAELEALKPAAAWVAVGEREPEQMRLCAIEFFDGSVGTAIACNEFEGGFLVRRKWIDKMGRRMKEDTLPIGRVRRYFVIPEPPPVTDGSGP